MYQQELLPATPSSISSFDDKWDNELSYLFLKNQGLVHCLIEYYAVKTAFCDNIFFYIEPSKILKWLKNQKQKFRNSCLSYIFISGLFGKFESNSLFLPKDIQNLILSYSNLIFIKFYHKYHTNKCEIRTFDGNFTFNNLVKILELEYNWDFAQKYNFIRIWLRFGALKFIYCINTATMHINHENQNKKRWVELPDIYYNLTLQHIDNMLQFEEILEIGVDIHDKVFCEWSFRENDKSIYYHDTFNRLEWISSLKVGDIICVDDKNALIVHRDFDTFYIIRYKSRSVPSDAIFNIEEVKSVGSDLYRLKPRYSQFRMTKYMGEIQNCQQFLSVFCEWLTDFKKTNDKINLCVMFGAVE